MIDIHSHVIYEVDDGPSTIYESLDMLREASDAGIKVIIATPHFHRDIFKAEKTAEYYQQLSQKAIEYDLTLLMGYEVFLDRSLMGINEDWKTLCLNNSRYMLIEFPFDSIPFYCSEMIYQLQIEGIIPIITHPERNRNFINNIDALIDFVDRGCLVQVDAASTIGVYGNRVRKFCKKLIKKNLAHFISSGAHYAKDYTNWIGKAYWKVRQWSSEEYVEKLFYKNAAKILENTKVDIVEKI